MPEYDVLAIGNAIVDVIASAEDALLDDLAIPKGSMRLISAVEAESLYARMGPGREVSGGSAANTIAGIAALGARTAFIGRVSDDQLGNVFRHDIRAAGVDYRTAFSTGETPTARCLIFVTPDAQRTMSTFLGSCQELSEADIDPEIVRAAKISYFEGYLWDPPLPMAAIRKANAIAREAGRMTAMTLSDVFCVEGHRSDFLDLISHHLDIVFANENEAKSLFQTDDVGKAIDGLAKLGKLAVMTRSEKGAVVIRGDERTEVPAAKAERVLDTTGAGDLFAGGFLCGITQGRSMRECAVMGTVAAAEIIEHYGARPETDLKARIATALS